MTFVRFGPKGDDCGRDWFVGQVPVGDMSFLLDRRPDESKIVI
jgi:hypothetical protein